MARRFDSPAAFRRALEQRLRTTAEARGVDLNALRLKLLIERLLARLFAEPNPPWRLKGGFAMELRLRASVYDDVVLKVLYPPAGAVRQGCAAAEGRSYRL